MEPLLRLWIPVVLPMIDMLEKRKVISGYEGSKPRQVLITEADLPRLLAELEEPAPTLSD